MSPTARWIISGILFFVLAYGFYRLWKKGESHSVKSSVTGGGAAGGNQGVRTEEKK